MASKSQPRDARGRFASTGTRAPRGNVQVTGVKNLEAILRRAGKRGPMLLTMALLEEGENIMTQSKEIVPHDTGALAASGRVYGPFIDANSNIEVVLGYGDTSVKYAVPQHERLDYRHAPGRKAKYLEGPAVRAVRGMAGRIANRMRSML